MGLQITQTTSWPYNSPLTCPVPKVDELRVSFNTESPVRAKYPHICRDSRSPSGDPKDKQNKDHKGREGTIERQIARRGAWNTEKKKPQWLYASELTDLAALAGFHFAPSWRDTQTTSK
jgi:hypothetical protein